MIQHKKNHPVNNPRVTISCSRYCINNKTFLRSGWLQCFMLLYRNFPDNAETMTLYRGLSGSGMYSGSSISTRDSSSSYESPPSSSGGFASSSEGLSSNSKPRFNISDLLFQRKNDSSYRKLQERSLIIYANFHFVVSEF